MAAGFGQRAIAADKGGAVAAVDVGLRGDGHKGDPIPVLGMVAIACQYGLDLVIPVGRDMHLGCFAVLAQGPFHIIGHRQPALSEESLLSRRRCSLIGAPAVLIHRNEDGQLLLDPVAVMLKDRVAGSMSGP